MAAASLAETLEVLAPITVRHCHLSSAAQIPCFKAEEAKHY